MHAIDNLKYDSYGLVPAVVQDAEDGTVLMVAYMNAESLTATLNTGRATFWSRSRQKLWVKGETSGHTQRVRHVLVDCDLDCLVVKVEQIGLACHEGYRSCFFREMDSMGERLDIVAEQLKTHEEIYGAD